MARLREALLESRDVFLAHAVWPLDFSCSHGRLNRDYRNFACCNCFEDELVVTRLEQVGWTDVSCIARV